MIAILFFDIDGVPNTYDAWGKGFAEFNSCDPDTMTRLNAHGAQTGCHVFVSSTWRFGPYRWSDGCRAHLRRLGFLGRFHRDCGPGDGHSYKDRPRGKQIRDYLLTHSIAAYAIIDDDSDMLPTHLPRYVQIRFNDG